MEKMHGFACHCEHVKKGGITGRAVHNLRLTQNHTNESINPELADHNYTFKEPEPGHTVYSESLERIERVREQGGRIRSDANWLEEFTFTVPVGMDLNAAQEYKYMKCCYEELSKKVGKDNVRLAVVHRDEIGQTHMHVMYNPITPDGRLSSKEMTSRKFLNAIHNDIPRSLRSLGFSVERGEPKGSGFKSKSVGEYKRDAKAVEQVLEKQAGHHKRQIEKSIDRHRKKVDKLNKTFIDVRNKRAVLHEEVVELKESREEYTQKLSEIRSEITQNEQIRLKMEKDTETLKKSFKELKTEYRAYEKVMDATVNALDSDQMKVVHRGKIFGKPEDIIHIVVPHNTADEVVDSIRSTAHLQKTLRNEIRSFRNKSMELDKKEREIDAMAKDIEKSRDYYEYEKNNLRGRVKLLESELARMNTPDQEVLRLTKEMDEMKKELTDKLDQEKLSHARARSEIADLTTKMRSNNEEHAKEIATLKAQNTKDITDLKETHATEKGNLEEVINHMTAAFDVIGEEYKGNPVLKGIAEEMKKIGKDKLDKFGISSEFKNKVRARMKELTPPELLKQVKKNTQNR